MMDETILSRVDVGRQPYFLQTTLLAGGTEGLRLILTDALNAWSGESKYDFVWLGLVIGQLISKVMVSQLVSISMLDSKY